MSTSNKDENCFNMSKELKTYINNSIGSICCDMGFNDKNYITDLETNRITRSKEVVYDVLNGIPMDDLTYIYHKEVRGLTKADSVDLLDIEILINYSILGVFKMIKRKNKAFIRYASDMAITNDDPSFIQGVVISAKYYELELNKLIEEKEEFIEELDTSREPTFNFIIGKPYKNQYAVYK